MATGMGSRGEYRLTAAHRITLLAFSLVLAAVGILSGPYAARAAVVWASEVRFPDDAIAAVPRWTLAANCASEWAQYPGDALATTVPRLSTSHTAYIGLTPNGGGCQFFGGTTASRSAGLGYATGGSWSHTSNGDPGSGIATAATIRVASAGYAAGDHCVMDIEAHSYGARNGLLNSAQPFYIHAPSTWSFSTDVTVPAGTRMVTIRYAATCRVTSLTVGDLETVTGGNCEGQAGAGTDSQLVWGSGALTSPTSADQWGHQWLAESCRFTESEVYHFAPAGGIIAGDTYRFGIQAHSFSNQAAARVSITWAGASGGPNGSAVSALNWTSSALVDPGTTGAYFAVLDAPANVSHLSISIGVHTMLTGLYIADVEGDAVLDGGTYPSTDTGTITPVPTDYWADCEPPVDALNVPGWLEYGICVVQGGFALVTDLVSGVARDMIAVWEDYVFPGVIDIGAGIGAALSWFLGELLATFFAPLTAALDLLFVPDDDVLARWETVTATAETRFPFSAASSIFDGVETGMTAAPSSVIGGLNGLEVVGQPLALGSMVGTAIGTVQPWRGFIFAGVVLLFIPRFIGVVFAAVGVTHVQPKSDGE